MADDKINKDNVTQAKEYLKTLIEAKDISRDITDFTKQLLKNYEGSSGQISAILSTYRDIGKAINDQSNNILQVLNNEKSTKDIIKDILKNQNLTNKLKSEELSLENERQSLLEEQLRLDEQANKAAAQGNMQLFDSYIKEETILKDKLELNKKILGTIQAQGEEIGYTIEANKIAKKLSEEADKKTKNISTLTNIVKSIPGLKAFSEPFEKASKAARDAALNSKSAAEIFSAGAKEFLGAIDFRKLGVGLGTLYVKAAETADERTTSIAKNLSIGKEAADGVYSNLKNLKGTLDSSLQSTKKIVEAFNDLSELSNFSLIATKNQVDAQLSLTKEIGVSKETALGYQSAVAVSNIDAKKGVDIVYDQIAAFANQNKIVADGRKIFDQISKTSKLIQLNFKGNFDSLVKATLQANKLGLSLDQVNKIGESLLNFEQSISSELEAELLTGRNINLEKARLFALNNDIAGLTQEIANQGITSEKFASMNRIQQEAIAKSLGMQASELGEALYNQKLIEQTAGNYTKELRNQAEQLKKSNNSQDIAKGIELEKRAAAIENGILQGKNLEQAQKSVTVQEQYADALEQAKELFSDIVTGGYIETLVNGFKSLVGLAKTLGTIIDIAIIKPLNIAVNLAAAAVESILALIPGSGVTLEDAKKSFEFAGANAMDMAVNTGNLLGVTDQKDIFTKQVLNNNPGSDDLRKVAGYENKDSAETNKLLNELIAQVKQGGNVYIDNRMAGTATALGTYKI
jgi:hypothetical protein